MCEPFRRPVRALAILLALLAASIASADHASAQGCTQEPCDPPDIQAPSVTVSPAAGAYATGTLSVTIDWSDNHLLVSGSRVITYGGTDVTGSFSYTEINGGTAQSTGTITIGAGSKTLTARICDTARCTDASATYTGAVPSVRVTPEDTTLSVASVSRAAARFRVANTGTATTRYALDAGCTHGFTACGASRDTLTLAPGDSAWVDASFVTHLHLGGLVSLTASAGGVHGTGTTTVNTVATPAPGFPGDGESLRRIQRDACVTVALGPGVASECGDLRVVHPLPTTTLLNRPRTPVLTYVSDHARPHPVVAEHLAGPATAPDSIRAVLLVNGTQVADTAWRGWSSAQTRRIALSFDASDPAAYPTGVHAYELRVTAKWADGTRQTLLVRPGQMIIVNRSRSPFGAGWWLAGVEQLVDVPGDSLKLWVGGDGSARLYRRAGTTLWRADGYDRPDSLYRALKPVGEVYIRTLPGGAEVWFSLTGQHLRTVNPMMQYTEFRWSGIYLEQVLTPYPAAQNDSARYRFYYDNNPAAAVRNLSRVVAPGARETVLHADASGRVLYVAGAAGDTVRYAYSGSTRWMTRRTDPRGAAHSFGYLRVRLHTSARVLSATDTAVTRVQAAQTLGMNGVSVRADSVYVVLDGPRKSIDGCDCLWWTVNRWGAPTSVRDVLGSTTTLRRGDGRFPGRVTEAVAPNGFVTSAVYDARGNPVSATAWDPYGDGRHATTTYGWDARWDRPARVVAPEGEVSLFGYDLYGRREWEQAGTHSSRRVRYRYYALADSSGPGLPRAVESPGQAVDSVAYDARGNLRMTVTPMGVRVDQGRDALGRVAWIRTPVEGTVFRYDSTFYNVRDQADSAVSRGGTQRVVVRNVYDEVGNLRSVSRRSDPDSAGIGTVTTQWVYDLGGRPVVEVAPDGMRDSTVYDAAGNVREAHTRRADPTSGQRLVIRMRYDILNRLVERVTPSVHYPARNEGMALRGFDLGWELAAQYSDNTPPYPWYPNDGGWGYRIPADTSVFAYDGIGRMLSATNRDAVVRRGWYPGGALAGDTLAIRTWAELSAGGSMTSHVYGLEFTYDRNGRRTEIRHPSNIAPLENGVLKDRTTYGYDPQTGALARVTDPLGTQYRYHYTARGEVDSLYLPGGITESYRYDPDGRLVLHQTHNAAAVEPWPANPLRSDTLVYDLRGKLLFSGNRTGAADSLSAQYTLLGHLASSEARSKGLGTNGSVPASVATETPRHDALGNQIRRSTHTTFDAWGYGSTRNFHEDFLYHAGTGRLRSRRSGRSELPYLWDHADTVTYDGAGNVLWETTTSVGLSSADDFRDRAYFYGADGTLRASDVRDVDDPTTDTGPYRWSFEEYRYDALGRRVLVRARRGCDQPTGPGLCSLGYLRRTVWDGDQELFEIQAPGGREPYYSQHMENDTAHINLDPIVYGDLAETNAFYGRVLYVHGLSLDHPLGVVRMGYGDRIDANNQVRPYRAVGPFSVTPHWNNRGQAVLGTFADGAWRKCQTIAGNPRCVWISWPELWAGYARPRRRDNAWHGSLLEDKSDASGLSYRRNRYYDPATGRFTQEDPIGLAGGLNLYGFAAGDPVNYADPYGLCPYGPGERNSDTSDCPDDNAGNAVRLIDQYGGEIGRRIIEAMIQDGYAPLLVSEAEVRARCGDDAAGCLEGVTMVLNQGHDRTTLVGDIVHEVGHGIIEDRLPWDKQYLYEEPLVWEWSLQVWGGIPEGLRPQRGGLGDYYRNYVRDPQAFRRERQQVACMAVQLRGGNC